MRKLWQRLRRWWRKLFRPKKPPAPSGELAPASFTLRGSILEELEYYFEVLRRLKRSDSEAFAALSRTGIWLLPPDPEIVWINGLTPWWRQNRPAFGAIAFATAPEIRKDEERLDKTTPRFIYFTQYKPRLAPPNLERTNYPQVYVVTCYWTSEGDKRFEAPTEYAVALSDDGDIKVLRQRLPDDQVISGRGQVHGFSNTGKYRTKPRRETFTVPRQRWGVPNFYQHWAKENDMAVVPFMKQTFAMAASAFEHAQLGMAQVRVFKGKLTAAFNIEIKRTSYFFRDREAVVIDGKKKRIFHIVRAHTRVGSERGVRFHFRGLREFDWHGYRITITVPGLHHLPITDLQEGMGDAELIENAEGWADMKTLGATLDDEMTTKLPNRQSWLRRRIER